MFAATCARCGARSLFTTSRITGIDRTPSGYEVRFRCWCGAEGTDHVTSRRRPRRDRSPDAAGERPESRSPPSSGFARSGQAM